MKPKYELIAPLVVITMLAACNRGLPPSLQRDIVIANDRVQNVQRQVQKSEASLNAQLAQSPDLFRGAAEVAVWQASLRDAKADLQTAQTDGRDLSALVERNRPDPRIATLLADEKRRSENGLQKAQSVDKAAAKWFDYQRDPAAFRAKINNERETVRRFDFAPVAKTVHRAEQDWPAKKTVLESRLSSLTHVDETSDTAVQSNIATLIAEEETLSLQAGTLETQAKELETQCGQLYDSWDKILTDLDHSQFGTETLYRERLKTVRTHFIDVPLKKTETHSDEHWSDISEASFHAVENDIGMAIAHKDAGLFDSEAQNTPQPPGFGYVASPSVGSNQYGYWAHNRGASVWTFLPQYLIMRELLWNHDYHPVMPSEYNAYRAAQSRGTTYYGRETPNAPPKYGTHGTFTQSHYADSRYVQSGGFKGSAYAAGGSAAAGASAFSRFRPDGAPGARVDADGAGRRFGRQPGVAPSGQHFGRAPGARPPGRSFGRRR